MEGRAANGFLPALILAVCLAAGPLTAQSDPPLLFENGAVNAASFMRPGVPGSGLARGSIITVFGRNLAEQTLEAQEFPIPQELGGVRVEIITADGMILAGLLLFVSPQQINVLLPSGTPVGEQRIRVVRDGAASNPARFKVVESSFGIFVNALVGSTELAGQDLLEPLARGAAFVVWGTGLGPISSSDGALPPVGDLPTRINVWVGGQPAEVAYQGRSGCCAGLDQLNVVVPPDAPSGCFVPVWVEVNGALHSNIATIAVALEGEPCWRTEHSTVSPLLEAPTGRFTLEQTLEDGGLTRDYAASFLTPAPGASALTALFGSALDPSLLPPPGSCLSLNRNRILSAPPGTRLDGGEQFELRGPLGAFTITGDPPGQTRFLTADPDLALSPGAHSLVSTGGASFPPFTSSFELAPAPLWNKDLPTTGTARVLGLNQSWAGGDESPVLLTVAAQPQENGTPIPGSAFQATFVCRAPQDSLQAIEVPAALWANLEAGSVETRLTSQLAPVAMAFETDGPENGLIVARQTEVRRMPIGRPHLPSSPVRLPGGNAIQAELATSFAELQRGLMFRPELPADQGMLFFFDRPGLHSFWMFQTLVPLDIVWLNADREIIFISSDTPPCPPENGAACPSFGPDEQSKFVLEIAAGEADRRDLQVGDRLDW